MHFRLDAITEMQYAVLKNHRQSHPERGRIFGHWFEL